MKILSLRRGATVAVLGLGLCGAAAGAADAATLTNAGGTLTYDGTDAGNDVDFAETGPNTVSLTRSDEDPITNAPENCTEDTPDTSFTCTGVTRVVANGNGGDDTFDASGLTTIPATLNGGAGADDLRGGDAGDTVNGDAGDDLLFGGTGDDTVDGGDGQDLVQGGEGNDVLRGGAGDDSFFVEDGNDDYSGGSGGDSAFYGFGATGDARASLDDQANDSLSAAAGEADNVRSDIETVAEFGFILSGTSGNDTLIGSAGANTLTAGQGNDTIEGGAGNDMLNGGNGDDTIRARDGFADLVNCGPGNDTAEVDTLDRVEDCETVNRADVGNANDVPEIPEDRPPTVRFTSPAPGALLPTRTPALLTADATDDRGISAVLFVDDERIVCADTVAPYTCAYSARGEDVGRNTLAVVAVDTAQQTASAFRAVNVDRFAPAGITGAVTPSRDRRAPFRFRSSGRLRLPAGVTPAQACGDGQVSIQVKAGAKTISTRRADLSRACTFSSTVTFRDRRRFTRAGTLRFTIRFTGNEVLTRTAAVARNVRTR
jgi:Ca2+-binding RTX toxin-like protein